MSDTPRELYRLARCVPDARGGMVLEPIIDGGFYDSWRAANAAARKLSTRDAPVVTSSVLVDARGRVVFPPPTTARRSAGRWHVAPVLRFKPAAPTGPRSPRQRPPRRPPGDGRT